MRFPRRIAVVIPQYGRIGGAENMAFQLCERLAAMPDFDIHVFARRWETRESAVTFHKVPMIRFPRWLQPVSFAGFARNVMSRYTFDMIHSHERIFAMDVMTFHGIPHKTWIRNIRKKSLSGFDRATCRVEQKGILNPKMKRILPVSTLVKRELLKIYPLSEDRITVVHPGVSVDRFSRANPESDRNQIRTRYGIDASDTVILFVGMNFEIKCLDLVLQGIAGLKHADIPASRVKLLVAGKGNPLPYQKMAAAWGIADQVIFAGVVREVESCYSASDIFVMPSRMDTFGLVVLEAMAAGLPVIVSPTVGAADLVVHGVNGFILPVNPSYQDMASALMQMMDSAVRRTMGEESRKIAVSHDWDRVASKMADIYRDTIDGLVKSQNIDGKEKRSRSRRANLEE